MKWRTIIFWCHLSAGMVAGSIIFIMSLTGAILSFESQVIEFAERGIRHVTVPAGQSQLNLDQLMAQVRSLRPEDEAETITVHNDPAASIEVSFGRDDKVYMDPYTGVVLGGPSRVYEWMRTVRSWHRWLGSRDHGRPVTGICNLCFLFLAVSGFYLWWPRRWGWKFIKPGMFFNGRLKGRSRDWNWHNVIGFWCAPFLIMITMTGAVISYPWASDLLYRMAGSEPPPARTAGGGNKDGAPENDNRPEVDLDAAIQQVGRHSDDWISLRVRLPKAGAKSLDMTVEENDPFYPSPRSTLTVDTVTAQPVKWDSYKDQSAGRKWRTWSRYLHTGQAGGVIGQFIGLIACIGGCFLVWTGTAMAWQRFFPRGNAAGK